jgi:hypothetical protein
MVKPLPSCPLCERRPALLMRFASLTYDLYPFSTPIDFVTRLCCDYFQALFFVKSLLICVYFRFHLLCFDRHDLLSSVEEKL